MVSAASPVAIPPRDTPARRAWFLRLVAIGLLPALAMAMGIMSIRSLDLAASVGEPWSELAGWFTAALIGAALLGVMCLFDKRTRVVGVFAVMVSLLVNPMAFALTLGLLGLV